MARLIVCILLVVTGPARAEPPVAPTQNPSEPPNEIVIRLPLDNGRLEVRDVFETILRQAGIDPGERLSGIDWTIDLGSTLGRLQLRVFDRIADGAISTEIGADEVVVTVDRRALAQHGEVVIDEIEQWMAQVIAAEPGEASFGLSLATADNPRVPIEMLPPDTRRVIVLVHGLDDPGWMWRDVVPALLNDGHVAVRFEYPNDQPIVDSTDLFARHLRSLRRAGVEKIDIVAHSMGGLVARDVLTRTAYYAGDGSGGLEYPAVTRLIMLGTPNHGSAMARLRGFSELGEVFSRWVSGDASWRDSLADGAGEAGHDLLPGSDFLRRLNSRPHAVPTTYTIVAGRVSPLSPDEVDALAARWQRITDADDVEAVVTDRVSRFVKSMVRGVGDGMVSIESARLAGVSDFVEVEADHLSMIVNVFTSGTTPPSIPIVLKRLGDD